MADKLTFEVRGSAGVVHTVAAWRDKGEVVVTCSCDAARNRSHCKHRLALLNGDDVDLLTPNPIAMDQLNRWLDGTKLQARLREVADAESIHDAAKSRLTALKKALGREMGGG